MLCVQPVGDSTVLTEKVSHCHLKRLELYDRGASRNGRNILPILSGARETFSITELDVTCEPITTCIHVRT